MLQGGLGALVHQHIAHFLAVTHGQGFVDDGFERQLLAAAQLGIGSDNDAGAHVNDALVHGLGRETAKHHTVNGANARASLHGHHAFNGHGHVDQDTVALDHAQRFERIGKAADAAQQFLVGDTGDRTVIGFENDRCLVLGGRAHVAVEAVGRGIELAVCIPLVERGVGFVQRLRERLGPLQVFAAQPRPETFVVRSCFGAQGLVGGHAGDACGLYRRFAGGKNTVLDEGGFNGRRRRAHGGSLLKVVGWLPPMSALALTTH
jgi:hypothetical protein